MGKGIRYSDEFKQEAVNQVSVNGYSVADVSERLGISTKTLYGWLKRFYLFNFHTIGRGTDQARSK